MNANDNNYHLFSQQASLQAIVNRRKIGGIILNQTDALLISEFLILITLISN